MGRKYVNYKRLKKCLKHATNGAAAVASQQFVDQFHDEVSRLNAVVLEEKDAIDASNGEIQRCRSQGDIIEARMQERALWRRTNELREFVELSYEAIYKAVKKHDKQTGIKLMAPVSNLTR